MVRKKLGILVNHLGNSQLAFQAVSSVNNYLRAKQDATFVFFNVDSMPMPGSPLCPVMSASECFCFDGPVIATSADTANRLSTLVGPPRKFYYVWDLEWIRPQAVRYEQVKRPLLDPKLRLIARHEEHKSLIESLFNRQVEAVVEDFSIEALLSLAFA